MGLSFSQKMGLVSATKSIQLEHIDDELKNGLWNLIKFHILDGMTKYDINREFSEYIQFCKILWHKHYKLPIDTIPKYAVDAEVFIRKRYFSGQWFEIYDFVEFMFNTFSDERKKDAVMEVVNSLLEKEFSAYRFINRSIAPISNKSEVLELEQAISQTKYFTSLNGANIHLSEALNKISDKISPDYRNSIKESISSVETACRLITGESSLGKSLHALEKKGIKINAQLKAAFDKMYAYTNDSGNGIRHAFVDGNEEPDFDDAKYMLIVCSSFINYLVGKCNRFGIQIS